MVGQASKHIAVADLKTDHVGPLLKVAIEEINHVQGESPEKERTNKEFQDALASTKRKLELVEEDGNNLKKRGIQLMTALQKINKEKKRNEEAQNKVQAEFNRAKRKSTDSQEEVDHLNKKLNSAQKAKQTLTSGRMQIANCRTSSSS